MKRKTTYLLAGVLTAFCFSCQGKIDSSDFTQYVNPFIGTAATGHTFPGATYPFGLIQASPQTGNFSWDYCGGYVYTDTIIQGFSQTRLNGTGVPDLGDILIQPFSGIAHDDSMNSRYSKGSEKASPGYYAVKLTDNEVEVEVTASPHVAFYKFQFANNMVSNLLIDFQSGQDISTKNLYSRVLNSGIHFEDSQTISGYIHCRRWVERKYFFVIHFDHPIVEKKELEKRDKNEKAPRYILTFGDSGKEELNMKIALSSTSVDGAKKNLIAEIPDWDFLRVRQMAVNEWNRHLSRLRINGTDDQKTSFYTSLYHLFIQPNNIADVDGKYVGPNGKITQATNGKFYSTLSQWDTFRAAFPLYTILSPEFVPDLISSMLDFSRQQGHLPVWALWGKENYCMIGNHSVPMIVEAYLKGFKGFSEQDAYNEVKKSLTTNNRKSDWDIYDKYGYYPFDLVEVESVSKTLESSYDDYAAALMAKEMGKIDDYGFFIKRSGYFENMFDKDTKCMRGKDSKGNWRTPFNPVILAHGANHGGDYTEGNALQYTWHVLQDISKLISLMGGKQSAEECLDSLFYTTIRSSNTVLDVTGLIGQYAHGNEPSHHIAYIYSYLDKPHKTQELIRKICSDFYKNKPDGLIGNDDCGQMSAWYIFSTLGFYPVNPVSGEFIFGAPQFSFAQIAVGENKIFTVRAKNLSDENIYVDRIELNGETYNKKHIDYKCIMAGGELTFYMTDKK